MTQRFEAPSDAARPSTFHEALAARPPILVVDGRLVDPARAAVSAFDRGLLLGDGVFDTMRLAAGAPFRAGAHLERLARSAAWLGVLDEAAARARVEAALDVALQAAAERGVREGSVRTTLTRGPGTPGLAPPTAAWPLLMVAVHPRAAGTATPTPLAAVVTATGRRNERSATGAHKTLAYADAVVALADARARGADDAVFLDTTDAVACGTASNVVALVGDTVVTPPAGGAVLPGVTRSTVLELAATLGLPTAERRLEAAELREARELWLTSSVRGIAPVVRLDDRLVGDGRAGPRWRELHEAYERLVADECRVW